jgi:hypothetical protein
MSNPTDLSKLSSTEIIAKIVNLALGCDGVSMWTKEANAKLHVLTVVLKQAVIREASVGTVSIKHVVAVGNFVDEDRIKFSKRVKDRHWIDYDLIPKEIT